MAPVPLRKWTFRHLDGKGRLLLRERGPDLRPGEHVRVKLDGELDCSYVLKRDPAPDGYAGEEDVFSLADVARFGSVGERIQCREDVSWWEARDLLDAQTPLGRPLDALAASQAEVELWDLACGTAREVFADEHRKAADRWARISRYALDAGVPPERVARERERGRMIAATLLGAIRKALGERRAP